MKYTIKQKLLNKIKNLTDIYAFEEIKNSNYTIDELIDILEELIRFNELEKLESE